MFRMTDVDLIAGQIIDFSSNVGLSNHESIVERFKRLTFGLAEYEREQVAGLVNFRLSAPVL